MRTQLVLSINVVYPEEMVFSNDRNVVTLQYLGGNNRTVGAILNFTNGGGDTVQLNYNSEQKYLVFNLLSVFKKMLGNDTYNTVTMTGSISDGVSTASISPVSFKLADGRTLHSRPHNAERVVYYYDNMDLHGFEVLSLYGGTVGQTTVQSGITKFDWETNLDSFDMPQTDGQDTRTIHFQRAAIGGDDTYQTGCLDGDDDSVGVFKVRYFNTDGCKRFLQGKIQNRKRTVGYTEWTADDIVRHSPNAMITSTTDEITVGFPSVARQAYAEDILYSPIIEYQREDGEWEPCIVSSKSVQLKNWNENDIEITFKTLA